MYPKPMAFSSCFPILAVTVSAQAALGTDGDTASSEKRPEKIYGKRWGGGLPSEGCIHLLLWTAFHLPSVHELLEERGCPSVVSFFPAPSAVPGTQ